MNIFKYPHESLRKRLVIAGIPEPEHHVDSLASRIPVDFNGRSFNSMSADQMAELVLYFITKGIIPLQVASEKALLDLPWGAHVCQFYKNKQDLLGMLVPYFRQGLEKNEACVWMVSDLTIKEAKHALAAAIPDLNRYIASTQMQIRHYSDFYTNPNGTVRAPDQLSNQFEELGLSVRAQGFEGLRAAGGVSWITNNESMSRFMDYETKVNHVIRRSRIIAVCTYPAKAAAMCRCRELIHNHDRIFVKRGEQVHDVSSDAQKMEAVFASLAAP